MLQPSGSAMDELLTQLVGEILNSADFRSRRDDARLLPARLLQLLLSARVHGGGAVGASPRVTGPSVSEAPERVLEPSDATRTAMKDLRDRLDAHHRASPVPPPIWVTLPHKSRQLELIPAPSGWWGARREAVVELPGHHRISCVMDEAWERARRGRGQVLLLQGEAGIGKSANITAFETRRREAGAVGQSLRGTVTNEPGGGMQGILQGLLRYCEALGGVEGVARWALRGDEARARRLTSLLKNVGPVPDGDATSYDIARLLGDAMRTVADMAPVAWIIEDLHAASEQAVATCRRLMHEIEDSRLLLAFTARPSLGASFREAVMNAGGRIVDVPPLDATDASLMARWLDPRREWSEACLTRVRERSGGVAFFMMCMLRSLAEGATALESIDPDIHAALAGPISRLEAPRRLVVEACSVAGVPLESADVASLLELEVDAARVLLAELVAAGLLANVGDTFVPRHDLLRDFVMSRLDSASIRHLQATVARLLHARNPAGPRAVAAVKLALASDLFDVVEARALAAVQHLANHLESDEMDAVAEAVSFRIPLSRSKPAREAILHVARELRRSGRPEAGLRRAILVVESSRDDGDFALEAQALIAESECLDQVGRRAESLKAVRRASRLARAAGDERLRAAARHQNAIVELRLDRPRRARNLYVRAWRHSRAHGEERRAMTSLAGIAGCDLALGREDSAQRRLERIAVMAGARGWPDIEALCLSNRAGALRASGDWAGAGRSLWRVLEHREKAGDVRGMSDSLVRLSEISRHAGDLSSARAHAERALGLATSCQSVVSIVGALSNLSRIDLLEGDHAAACRRAREARSCRGIAPRFDALNLLNEAEATFLAGGETAGLALAERALAALEAQGANDVAGLHVVLGWMHFFMRDELEAERRFVMAERLCISSERIDLAERPAAWLARIDRRDPTSVMVRQASPATARAEAHALLAHGAARAVHAPAASALLDALSMHLSGEARERFRSGNLASRILGTR